MSVHAQQARGAGPPPPPQSGQTQAPYDLTGYWVAMVTDDWRYRMQTPPKGNVDYLPATQAARDATNAWDPAKDEAAGEQCRAYGAAGVMRMPGRLHMTWETENVLRIDTDAGTQTRRLLFGPAADVAVAVARGLQSPRIPRTEPQPIEPTWQGYSVARWQLPPAARGRGPAPTTGQLVVTTTRMRPGYLRKNGVPYSANATLTEYLVRLVDDGGQEYLAVTQFVDDPQYLAQPYVKTYQFRKQRDASGWSPTPCSAR